ncbi:MAG: hypothetical protein J1E38_06650 [Paramuribaculum sp.]|nr:hypothetical protein [Paramuribaculum sp.]
MEGLISIIVTIAIAALVSFLKDKTKKKEVVPPPMPDLFADDEQEIPEPPRFETVAEKEAFPIYKMTLPEEGERVTADLPTENVFEKKTGADEQIIRHREKWRQAIINAEILAPKFH